MKNIRMRFPGGLSKALTLSYDDGVRNDYRLIEIMRKHGLCGTFNINSGLFGPDDRSGNRLSRDEAKALYSGEGIEAAIHGTRHPSWSVTPEGPAVYDILNDRLQLEKLFERPIIGGAYPNGAYSDAVVEQLRICGIRYCRTTVATESTRIPTDWLRLHPTCHHNHPRLMEMARSFVNGNYTNEPRMFYLWGHSYEFPRDNNWGIIEEFAELMGSAPDIWHATNTEIYNYITAYNALQFTLDGDRVYNPTATEVWFAAEKETISVKPGETVSF